MEEASKRQRVVVNFAVLVVGLSISFPYFCAANCPFVF